jgi:DNA-binding GntR family transcriptional regulator
MSTPSSSSGRPLSAAAYQILRERILTCELAPGERLTERRTAITLGLGLSPVRDALARLVHEGLVHVVPRKGYLVKPLTVRGIEQLFTAWRIVGPEVARLGIAAASPEQRAQLSKLVEETHEVLAGPPATDRAAQFTRLAIQSFGLLSAASGNILLQDICRSLESELSRAWAVILTVEPLVHLTGEPGARERLVHWDDPDRAAEEARWFIDLSQTAALGVLNARAKGRTGDVIALRPKTLTTTGLPADTLTT